MSEPLQQLLAAWGVSVEATGIVIVDHGSRVERSNELLNDVVDRFRAQMDWSIVEPAHMELAEPTIADAFAACVRQGAKLVVVHPYFLLPGRHWREDIPRLAAAAAADHEGVQIVVTPPLGIHDLMSEIMQDRIVERLRDRRS